MTWPLAANMAHSVTGQIGDNIYFVWMISWFRKALFELHVNPFDVWFLNFPEGWNLAYTEITPAQIAIALPASFLGGNTFAYNFTMLASFTLSALGMFLWCKKLTGRFDAALLGGMIFGFLPYRFAHFLIGHLNLSGTQWLPLFFYGFFEVLLARRRILKMSLLAGVMLGLVGLTSQYYLYMALLVCVFLILVYGLFFDRKLHRNPFFRINLIVLGLVALPLILVSVAPFATLAGQGGLQDRLIGNVRMYSASPMDFILPSTDHFLWGDFIGRQFNRDMWVEGSLYFGAVALVLAIIALFKRKQTGQPVLLQLLLWGSLFSILLAMGTDLHWNGNPVEITTPAFLSKWINRPAIPILLPGYFLFKYFPFFAKLRALMRFGVFALIFCSAAASIGAAWLLAKIPLTWRKAATVLLLALVFVDLYPGAYAQMSPVEPRPVDAWLAKQPGEGALVQFPFEMSEDQEQVYYTLFHGKPFVGGFFNAFPPEQYARLKPLMSSFPDASSVEILRSLGVQYVLVSAPRYPDAQAVRKRIEDLGLTFMTHIETEMVFELPQ